MLQNNSNKLPVNLFFLENNKDFLHKFFIFSHPKKVNHIYSNFFISKEQYNKLKHLNDEYSIGLTTPSIFEKNTFDILDENNKEKQKLEPIAQIKELSDNKKKSIFKIIYPEKVSLFTNMDNNFEFKEEVDENKTEDNLFIRKKMPRKENKDNIRRKIKRSFFNKYVIPKLNMILKNNGSNLYFMRLPQSFVSDICIKNNKKVINMTLSEIFLNEEININNTNKDLNNYFHNLKVINNMDIKENKEFQKILNMKFYELFNEYLNSVEFQIDEINRLKKKKFENSFINRYISISKNFIDFFSK